MISPSQVLRLVAEAHDVDLAEMVGCRRHRKLVYARQHAAYVLHEKFPNLSRRMVGDLLGGRDTSTIIYSCRQWPIIKRWRPRQDAQVAFELLSAPTEQPYRGRYQDQKAGPQPAIAAAEGDL